MKTVTTLSLLLLLASPAFGQLTKEDLRTIMKEENAALEKRMKEYIDLKIDGVEKSLNARIDGVEKNLNARIDAVDQKLTARIDGVEKSLNARIAGLDKRMDNMWRLMMGLFGLVAATIAVPQIIIAYRDRGRKEMERSQKEMQLQIDRLREQIEAMNQ